LTRETKQNGHEVARSAFAPLTIDRGDALAPRAADNRITNPELRDRASRGFHVGSLAR